MRHLVVLLMLVVGCLPLSAFAAQHKLATTKSGLFCLLGNPLSQNLKFVYDDQRRDLLVIDSTGNAYPLVVRSAVASNPDSTEINPAMPDWSATTANVARDNLDRQIGLVRDSLLDAGIAKIKVAESMATLYQASALVDSVWFDNDQVCVRWRGWQIFEPKLVKRSHPLPSQQEQLANWLVPIIKHAEKGDVVIVGLDGLVTYYDAVFAPLIRQEAADLQAGREPQTRLIRNPDLKKLFSLPVPLSQIKVIEER